VDAATGAGAEHLEIFAIHELNDVEVDSSTRGAAAVRVSIRCIFIPLLCEAFL
jgi:hypothetical protein